MRIIFMGSPDFAVPTLEALVASDHEVIAAYAQAPKPAGRGHKLRPCPVHAYAEEHNIPVFTPASLKGEEEQTQFASLNAEVAVVAAYGMLLPKAILEAPTHGCINVHPSDLPRWRGAAPLQRALMAGDTQTAMCIMQMDEGLDTGDILWRKEVKIEEWYDAGLLHHHMAEHGAEGILETLTLIESGNHIPQKQSEHGVTYAKKIDKAEAKIDWNRSSREIFNHIRALSPYPGAYFTYKDEKIKVLQAVYIEEDFDEHSQVIPGEIGKRFLLDVRCGDGKLLALARLQRQGKKPMEAKEFMNGFSFNEGDMVE